MTQKNPLLNPVVKWVGGKRQLLPVLTPLIPHELSLYVEPFVGGGAVLLACQPRHARISDSNEELINVYRIVRDAPDELLSLLEEHARQNTSEYYYHIRGLDRGPEYRKLSDCARAARFIYLNKTGFNGLFRVNSLGQINVPYGRYKHPNIVNECGIRALHSYLQGDIEILSGDYSHALHDLPEGAFVYLDPPYMPISTTASFTGYTSGGFGYDEQVRLRDECVKLRDQGVSFLQSNSDCEAIRTLYSDFTIHVVKAKRTINSRADRRGTVNEVLISA